MPHLFTIACCSAISVLIATSVAVEGEAGAFKITTKRDTDKVTSKIEKGVVVFSILSPFGISEMAIERTTPKWPDAMTLRLHLNGLSSFQASNAKVTLNAAASVQNAKMQARIWKDRNED